MRWLAFSGGGDFLDDMVSRAMWSTVSVSGPRRTIAREPERAKVGRANNGKIKEFNSSWKRTDQGSERMG